jgi:hypothetical protein
MQRREFCSVARRKGTWYIISHYVHALIEFNLKRLDALINIRPWKFIIIDLVLSRFDGYITELSLGHQLDFFYYSNFRYDSEGAVRKKNFIYFIFPISSIFFSIFQIHFIVQQNICTFSKNNEKKRWIENGYSWTWCKTNFFRDYCLLFIMAHEYCWRYRYPSIREIS